MNPFAFARRRPALTLMSLVILVGAVIFGLYTMRVDIPALHTTTIYARLDELAARLEQSRENAFGGESGAGEEGEEEEHKIVVTSPEIKDVTLTQKYVCQIHAQNHIEVCALEGGYLEEILVKEGQSVKKGDLMFRILPTLFQAKVDAKEAEAQLAKLEYEYSKKLSAQNVVSENEVALKQARLTQANAEAELSRAELNFTKIKAPFDGIVDRRRVMLGSLIDEGEVLTTLSDNSLMWVYFNVPEKDYLEYMAFTGNRDEYERIELNLPGGSTFNQTGKIGAIEAKFNNETGNIAFRADFPNPDRLLRHGQTGTVVIHHILKDAVVIPQRAKFEILAKQYVFVITDEKADDDNGGDAERDVKADDKEKSKDQDHDENGDEHLADVSHKPVAPKTTPVADKEDDEDHAGGDHLQHGVVRQREIVIQNELDDVYVIQSGLKADDKIILEGIRQVRDGDKVEYQFISPEKALDHLKFHAE